MDLRRRTGNESRLDVLSHCVNGFPNIREQMINMIMEARKPICHTIHKKVRNAWLYN